MKREAEALWSLLDDIDTVSDVIKPTSLQDYMRFYNYTMMKVSERHKYLKSDGYQLYPSNEYIAWIDGHRSIPNSSKRPRNRTQAPW